MSYARLAGAKAKIARKAQVKLPHDGLAREIKYR